MNDKPRLYDPGREASAGADPTAPLRQRLSELSGPALEAGDPMLRKAATLLQKAPQPRPLSAAALDRIGGQLATAKPAGFLSKLGTPSVGVVAVVATAVTWTALVLSQRTPPAPQEEVAPKAVQEPLTPPQAAPVPVAKVVVEPLPISPAPVPVESPPKPQVTVVPHRSMAVASRNMTGKPPAVAVLVKPESGPAAVSAESQLAAESRLLGVALHQLRQEHDAVASLRSLDSYSTQFPQGALTEEAQAARVDALLSLSRRTEALKLLDTTQFVRLGRAGELAVTRGELRAAAGRYRDAQADFAAVLRGAPATQVAERALYGQAMCRAYQHDTTGARADLQDYLSRFPAGRFVPSVKKALASLPGSASSK